LALVALAAVKMKKPEKIRCFRTFMKAAWVLKIIFKELIHTGGDSCAQIAGAKLTFSLFFLFPPLPLLQSSVDVP
jgi:hypothetical protein